LAGFNRQENVLAWQLTAAKEGYLLGVKIIISLAANRQENTYHQLKKL